MTPTGTDSNEISPQQQRAIAALLSTRSVVEAATVAKTTKRTLFRWLTEPAFKAHLASAEGELIATATRRLLQYQEAAVTVIVSIMANKQLAAGVRLRAAMAVVDYMLKLRELNTIEERLAALEENFARQIR